MARKELDRPEEDLENINHELLDAMEDVISRVTAKLPAGFQAAEAEAVFDGMRRAKSKLLDA